MRKNNRAGAGVRPLVLATLLLSGLAVGCESDDGMGPEAFNEEATAADVDAVLSAVDEDIAATLLLAAQGLANAGGTVAAMPPTVTLRPSSGLESVNEVGSAKIALAAERLLLSALVGASAGLSTAAEPVFPSELLGKTFVWGDAGYVVDDTLPGAPANGVRFVVYAINPVTRQPVIPLIEVGYLDLTDESGPTSSRIGLLMVDTSGEADVTLVDYFIDVSIESTQTSASATLFADGFVSDGTETLAFVLAQTLSFDQSGSGSFIVDYDFSVAGSGVSLGFDASTTFDAETQETAGLTVALTLSHGGDVVVLSVTESTAGLLDGEITFNGATAILVSGTALDPDFSRPDGSELTATEVQALVDIVDAVTEVLLMAEDLFAPISGAGAV